MNLGLKGALGRKYILYFGSRDAANLNDGIDYNDG